jgi:capsid protein
VAVLVNNIIGAGIMPRAASGDDALDRKVDVLFERWSSACDADGQLDFYGLQTLICREMVEAGEVLVHRRLRRSGDGLDVPVQLQVLEADVLDATKSGASVPVASCRVSNSTPLGRRRAYWLHAEHPGDAYGELRGLGIAFGERLDDGPVLGVVGAVKLPRQQLLLEPVPARAEARR